MLLTIGFCVLGAVGMAARRFATLPDRLHSLIAESCARSESVARLLTWLNRVATLGVVAGGIGLVWPIAWLDVWSPTLAWIGAFTFWISFGTAFTQAVSEAIEAGELAPLFVTIEELIWKAEWREVEYRDALLEHLHTQLRTEQRHEAPVERGTHVDLRVTHRGVDWFITIKKGIDNQKRLTLQGEAEDIIAHVQERPRKFGILVLLGLDGVRPGKQETHARSLENHLMARSVSVESRGKGVRCYVLRLVIQLRIPV